MQTSQVPNAAELISDLPKERSIPESTKRKLKKSSARAERLERKRQRKIENAVLGKKATKASRQMQANPIEEAQNESVKVATSTQSQEEGESPAGIKASIRRVQERSRARGKEANGNDSTDNVPGEQMAISQKLEDIMDILFPQKNPKKPGKPVKATRKKQTSLNEIRVKRVVTAMLDELQKKGESVDLGSRQADAMISESSGQLLARLKTIIPGKRSGSPDQSKVILLILSAGAVGS